MGKTLDNCQPWFSKHEPTNLVYITSFLLCWFFMLSCAHQCMQLDTVCMWEQGCQVSCPLVLHFIPLRKGPSEPEAHNLTKLMSQQASGVYLSLLPSTGFSGICNHTHLLHGLWRFELRSLCLQENASYPLGHLQPLNCLFLQPESFLLPKKKIKVNFQCSWFCLLFHACIHSGRFLSLALVVSQS